MINKYPKLPYWMDNLLQGLAFFIAYKNRSYWNYSINEGTIVDELCTLLNANLKNGESINREFYYKNISNTKKKIRADLYIQSHPSLITNDSESYLLEIKRYSFRRYSNLRPKFKKNHNPTKIPKKIDDDLKKMTIVLDDENKVRAFLAVISQKERPNVFVDKNGLSKNNLIQISGMNDYFAKVRRTVKAAHSFKKVDNAYYVCLLEIFRKDKIKEI